jgi:hypothetical protein
VQKKRIKDWNNVFLSHSYEDLCSCLHKYLFTYLFFPYNYYVITILPTMDSTHSQTMSKPLKINILIILHKFNIWNFQLFIKIVFLEWRCFQRPQTLTYIQSKIT